MALTLADSDILIDYLKGRGSPAILAAIASHELATTTVTRFEVLCGALTAESVHDALVLFAALVCLSFDDSAAERAAEIDRSLRTRGLALPAADTMIAGIALSHGLRLMTRNRRHFDRIPGLVLVEP